MLNQLGHETDVRLSKCVRYANGDKYYGQWRSGMRHGIGRIEWRDGHMYEGSWREDIVCPGAKSKKKPKDKPGGLRYLPQK